MLASPPPAPASAIRFDRACAISAWRRPVQWLHVHKAAGSTFCALAQRMGERIVAPHGNCNSFLLHDLYHQRFDQPRKTCEERQEHFRSHCFTWGAVETSLDNGTFCEGYFLNAAALREPISRLESNVNFRLDEDFVEGPCRYGVLIKHLRAGRVPPELQHQCRFHLPTLENYVTRLLGGSEVMMLPAGSIGQEHFERARGILERFDLVVPLETLLSDRRAVSALNQALGWTLRFEDLGQQFDYHGHKVAPSGPHSVRFSGEELDFLRHLNRFDIALYEYALANFTARLAAFELDS
uniref:Sulfotransferase family protein n=1 Tax=Alexandrium catenella TaxID=2925 RepID=A0A7S1WNA4_ALECA